MTKLSELPSTKLVKTLYIGDSGTGKTGSLVSLVKAGYKLRILDLDNGMPVLRSYIKHECPEKIDNVDAEIIQDQVVGMEPQQNGPPMPKYANPVKSFQTVLNLLNKWSDGSIPSEWGEGTVLVVDSLTRLGYQAYNWCRGMNPNAKEPRTWYYSAQEAVRMVLEKLTLPGFNTNVIVISHIDFREVNGLQKGFPNSIGAKLGPEIPTYFNNMILAERIGFGQNASRKIQTFPTDTIDLKTSAPFAFTGKAEDLGTGLAMIFKTLKDE
jgi:hypothetical protein